MGLFDFLRNNENAIHYNDKIWVNQHAKLNGLLQLFDQSKNIVLIAWFEETKNFVERFLAQANQVETIIMAKQSNASQVENKTVIFLEHYPLRKKEQTIIQGWQAKEIIFLSALDEPFLQQFGGEKILAIMQQLGIKEEECIEHEIISKSIVRAQEKLEEKILLDPTAHSAREWFSKYQFIE